MAYNFPVGYQPYYSPQFTPNQASIPQSQQTQTSSIIWVQGEAGAKSYLVAPNTTVQLWDSERQTIYLKSADASGMPSIKVLDYTIRQEAARNPVEAFNNTQIEISRKDLDVLQSQIDALKEDLKRLHHNESEVVEA